MSRKGQSSGQVLVLIAAMAPVLIAAIGLSVDVGMVVVAKRSMQAAADLAALAGAQAFLTAAAKPAEIALDYAAQNGLDVGATQVTVDDSGQIVTVESRRPVPTFFMAVFGFKSTEVQVVAAAQASPALGGTAFDDVLFMAAQDKALKFPGSANVFAGRSHTNGDLIISGHGNYFQGTLEIVGDWIANPENHYAEVVHPAALLPLPEFDLADLRKRAARVYEGSQSFANLAPEGIIFVNGNVNISGSSMHGKGIIVATGSINIASSHLQYESADDLIAFYALGDISLAGSSSRFDGIFYAPQGRLAVSGSGNSFYGALIAWEFTMPGSNNRATYDPRTRTLAPPGTVRLIR